MARELLAMFLALFLVQHGAGDECGAEIQMQRKSFLESPTGDREARGGIALQMLRRQKRLTNLTNPAPCPGTTQERSFYKKGHAPVVLWSAPGSGNTFVRALIETSTGIYSGSVSQDQYVVDLLPGEAEPVESYDDCSKLSVIKAQTNSFKGQSIACGFPIFTVCDSRVSAVVMLVRHPLSAAWAQYQREAVHGASWASRSLALVAKWSGLWHHRKGRYSKWMAAYGTGSYHLVRFEDLTNPLLRHIELQAIVDFIGLNATSNSIACAFSSELAESFRRERTSLHGSELSTVRRLQNTNETEDPILEPHDVEAPAAHDAWLSLGPMALERAWLMTLPHAESLGYTINITDDQFIV